MERKKRIIITVTNDLATDQRMQKTAMTLSGGGYDILLIGRKLATSLPFSPIEYATHRIHCFFTKGKLFYIEYNLRLFLFLMRQNADAVLAVDLDTIAPAFIAADMKGWKKIYDAHEYFTEVPEVVNRPFVKKIWEKIADYFTPKADFAYTVSDSLAMIFTEKYHQKFEVVRNVPMLSLDEKKMVAESYFLYQGAVNEGRGLAEFITVIKGLPILLKIAGKGDVLDDLKKQVIVNEQQSQVIFLGELPPQKLREVTQNAFIGVNLLENKGASYYYSLANKFFDYVHAGVPQLCIAFPEYQSINEKYKVAFLIENLQTDTIKSAVIRLINDSTLYNELKNNTKKCAAENNWETEGAQLLHYIKKIV